jgi:exopolysaccharide production protein ExoQ
MRSHRVVQCEPYIAVANRRASARQTDAAPQPSSFEWVVAVFAVIIQMGAFVSLALVISGGSLREQIRDPSNTVAIGLSATSLGVFALPRIRQMGFLASKNVVSALFIVLVLMSTIWSLNPDLTIRRGAGYLLTMVLAAYMSVRFGSDGSMRVLSRGFAVAAIGSLVFVAAFPQYGIMGGTGLAGEWRGVFPHKNVLGPVMAVAVFTELYLLVVGSGRPRWRWALLGLYLALVVLSQSATAWFLSAFYLTGTCVYLLWKRDRLAGVLALIVVLLIVAVVVVVFGDDPERMLGLVGKDTTLSGRTTLWSVVAEFIRERPVLGWGYRAMWNLDDPTTTLADKLTGGWGVTSSHNAFLEITLQLGLVGVALVAGMIVIALWRALRCCRVGIVPLGWFSLMFFVGAIVAAQTLDTMGQNQVIDWVLFNVLAFSCGIALSSPREYSPASVRRRSSRPPEEQKLGRHAAPQRTADERFRVAGNRAPHKMSNRGSPSMGDTVT